MAGYNNTYAFGPDATRNLMNNGYGLETGMGIPLNRNAGSVLGIKGMGLDAGVGAGVLQNTHTLDM